MQTTRNHLFCSYFFFLSFSFSFGMRYFQPNKKAASAALYFQSRKYRIQVYWPFACDIFSFVLPKTSFPDFYSTSHIAKYASSSSSVGSSFIACCDAACPASITPSERPHQTSLPPADEAIQGRQSIIFTIAKTPEISFRGYHFKKQILYLLNQTCFHTLQCIQQETCFQHLPALHC